MRIDSSMISRQWQSAPKMSPAVQRVCTRTSTAWEQGVRAIAVPGRPAGPSVNGRAVCAEIAAHQCDMALASVHFALVGDHAELAVAGLDPGFAGAHDVALVAQAVANQLRHGEHLQAMLPAERDQVGDARHLAVVAHDLADDAGGIEPGEARQVDRCLRLAGAHQHPAPAGAQRKDVAGTGKVRRGRLRGSIATRMVCARSAAEMPVVTPSRASMVSVKAVPKREELCCVMGNRRRWSARSSVSVRQMSPRP